MATHTAKLRAVNEGGLSRISDHKGMLLQRESFSEQVGFQREETFPVKWLYFNLLFTPNLRPCIDNKN